MDSEIWSLLPMGMEALFSSCDVFYIFVFPFDLAPSVPHFLEALTHGDYFSFPSMKQWTGWKQ